jgi:phenylpropionate dioxygenase-like ring-hydroxylating dioxygenase large terminal subunit
MIKNNWYVAGESAELTDKPRRVRMLGQNYAIFRDASGKAACLSDVCIHRGSSLAGYGKVVDGCIECPYHGWRFNSEGECTLIPAAGPGKPITKKARVDAYPTIERYGFVWVFLGDAPEHERPPLPEYPEFDDHQTWKLIRGRFFWRANYARVVENGIDPAHASFVHANVFGNPEDPRIPPVLVSESEFGAESVVELERPRSKGLFAWFRREPEKPCVRVRVGFQMAGLTITLRQQITPKMRLALFDVNTPVDDDHTQTYWILARTFLKGDWADFDTHRRNMIVFEQDRRIVEEIEPELVPDLSEEVSVKSDALQIAFRKKRQEMIDRGWGIDGEKLSQIGTKRALMVPSPARREDDSRWALKTVPTLPAAQNGASRPPQEPGE